MRRALRRLAPCEVVFFVLESNGLRILTAEQAVARAQELVRRFVPGDRDRAGELIKERREEADAS